MPKNGGLGFLFVKLFFSQKVIFKTLQLYKSYKIIYPGVSVTFPQFFFSSKFVQPTCQLPGPV